MLLIFAGASFPGYARGDLGVGEHFDSLFAVFFSLSAALSLASASFAVLFVRGRMSRPFTFHVCFFSGLALLGYCLWAVLILFPILDHPVLMSDWSTRILHAVFIGPLVCLFVVSVALVLLGFATLYDINRDG